VCLQGLLHRLDAISVPALELFFMCPLQAEIDRVSDDVGRIVADAATTIDESVFQKAFPQPWSGLYPTEAHRRGEDLRKGAEGQNCLAFNHRTERWWRWVPTDPTNRSWPRKSWGHRRRSWWTPGAQCLGLGETHHAVSAGILPPEDIHAELGEVLLGERPGREGEELIVCDLTGVGAQDAAMAGVVWDLLG